MKKIIAAVLAAVILTAGLSAAVYTPVKADATPGTSFPDIGDASLARDAAALRMLGVVSGDASGNFQPDGSLTRAAFCKMAVIAIGRGGEEPTYRNRTIFPDVRADHWARGYINIAVSGDGKFITGGSDGRFKPDDPVTAAQAVTMVMRILGYADADAGMVWPDGYMALAAEKGLTDGLSFSAVSDTMTRAQAARLFCNMLGTVKKGGGSFLSGLGTATSGVVVMQLNTAASDGTAGAVRTSLGVYKTKSAPMPALLVGLRGTLLRDADDRILTFLPDRSRQTIITASAADASWVKDAQGVSYDIDSTAAAYTAQSVSVYGTAFADIAPGMSVTLFYNGSGTVEAVYIGTAPSNRAVVNDTALTGTTLSQLTGGDTDYTVYKNGVKATATDLAPYDVMTYDPAGKILRATDFRVSGCLESCWPNLSGPTTVTVLGHAFSILKGAGSAFSGLTLGQQVTLLLTSDFQVAGVVTNGTLSSTAIGIVQSAAEGSASVRLFNGLVLSGNPNVSSDAAARLVGELVSVSSSSAGLLSLSTRVGSNNTDRLDLTNMTLGAAAVNPSVRVYERAGKGSVAQIALDDITVRTVEASKVLYVEKDSRGGVTTLLLNDVTGDRYIYGILSRDTSTTGSLLGDITNPTVSVMNAENKTGTAAAMTAAVFSTGDFGGVSVPADTNLSAEVIPLIRMGVVSRSDFYVLGARTYVKVGTKSIPVSAGVECYNGLGKTWFTSLKDARAFSSTLTIYCDRQPDSGGKVRVVVAEP